MLRRPRVILGLIVLLLIFLLSLPLPVSQNLKAKLIDISSPLLKTTNYLTRKVSWIEEIFRTAGENRRLRKELTGLKAELSRLKEAGKEAERLQKLLSLKTSLPYETIPCRVIGRDASTWFKTLIIDKGSAAGIGPDLALLGTGGVIGRVISCGKGSATVLLITDTNSSIGAMVQESRVAGLVEGKGCSECILNYISKKRDLPAGATVVTSGLGTIFPKGLVIGRVTEITTDSQGLYKIAGLELAADINRVEEVLVIKKPEAGNQPKTTNPRGW